MTFTTTGNRSFRKFVSLDIVQEGDSQAIHPPSGLPTLKESDKEEVIDQEARHHGALPTRARGYRNASYISDTDEDDDDNDPWGMNPNTTPRSLGSREEGGKPALFTFPEEGDAGGLAFFL